MEEIIITKETHLRFAAEFRDMRLKLEEELRELIIVENYHRRKAGLSNVVLLPNGTIEFQTVDDVIKFKNGDRRFTCNRTPEERRLFSEKLKVAQRKRWADKKAAKTKHAAAVTLGQIGGKVGGKARAESLTSEERSVIAKKAAKIRWAKKNDIALQPASKKERPQWFPGNYQWENSTTRYYQLLGDTGLIIDSYWERK